jgi:hypothetical protein
MTTQSETTIYYDELEGKWYGIALTGNDPIQYERITRPCSNPGAAREMIREHGNVSHDVFAERFSLDQFKAQYNKKGN